ncbi:hypothetical protein [Nocardia sp. CDC160]|uniref:hypothetical protein n=1 Tax=Nocardia sp. CDC160 TaxID=3112166 RepID=UPI002DB65E16|nr:hypothetical protein [Nocardia sp. CDC160]MEC3919374.1 hypothetical protein [Nocardia sp. CDC160]
MSDTTNHALSWDTAAGRELVSAAANEVRTLAERTDGVVRKRLLVVAHVLELAERELSTAPGNAVDAAALAREIRSGAHDQDLIAQAVRLRERVRRDLAVAHPGYDEPVRP